MASPIDSILEQYMKRKGFTDKSKQKLNVEIKKQRQEHDIFHGNTINSNERSNVADQHNIAQEEIATARAQRRAAEAQMRASEKKENTQTFQKGSVSNSGKLKVFIAFIIALAYDIFNVFENIVAIGTLGVSELGEAGIGDTVMQVVMMGLLGPYYKAITVRDIPIIGKILKLDIPATWIEYIPFLDFIPVYTIVTWKALKAYQGNESGVEDSKARIQSMRKPSKEKSNLKVVFNQMTGGKSGKILIVFFILALLIGISLIFTGEKVAASLGKSISNATLWWQEGGIWKLFNKFAGLIQSIFEKGNNLWQQQYIAATTGQTFAGEVDQYANKELGLKIDIEKPDYYFIKDQDIFMSGILSGRALNPNICEIVDETCDIGTINIKCSTNKNEVGIVTPKTERFEIIEDSFTPLTCEFASEGENSIRLTNSEMKNNIAQRTIYMKADFKFITAAYAKKEFVSESKFIELKTTDYEFEEQTPQYTPGPVSIQFLESFIDQTPLLVNAGRAVKIGFRLENTGEGIIDHFEKISLIIPEGIKVRACNAPFSVNDGNKKELIYEDNQNNFLRDARNTNLATGKRITLTCDLDLEESKILDLNSDITTDFFQVIVIYKYEVIESESIEIRKQEIIEWLTDELKICSVTQCECRPSGNKIKKGTNCRGDTQSEIDTFCKANKDENSCNNKENTSRCKWAPVSEACRAKTIEAS